MTGNAERAAGASEANLQALLDRIEAENPNLSEALLMREVDSILGRVSTPAKPAARIDLVDDEPRRASSAFEWYQPIVAALPPILDHDRTVQAAIAVEAGLFAEERLALIDRATASRTYLRELRNVIEIGRAEYQLLILSNLRLVFHWCKGIARSVGEDWVQDAFQAGCLGLMRGLQGWDHTMGYLLSTFVSWHIRQSIQRWRMNEVGVIRIPAHVWEKLDTDAADKLSPDVRMAALRAQNVLSLDEIIEAGDSAIDRVFDHLGQTWDGGLDVVTLDADRDRLIALLLDSMTEREANVIRLRYGLAGTDGEPQTLEAIGQMYGVTRERIRQLEAKALDKLRTDPSTAPLADLI